MTDVTRAIAFGLASSDGHLERDVFCTGCGYNLRTLPIAGACTECGQPIATTLTSHLHRLPFADPDWLETVTVGFRRLLYALAATIVGLILMVPILDFATWMRDYFELGFGVGAALQLLVVTVFGAVVLALTMQALLRITTPEPNAVLAASRLTARQLTRACIPLLPVPPVLLLLGQLAEIFAPQWVDLLGRYGAAFAVTSLAIMALSALIYTIVPVALIRYVTLLLRRVPNRTLARINHATFIVVLISAALVVAAQITLVITFAITTQNLSQPLTASSTAPATSATTTAAFIVSPSPSPVMFTAISVLTSILSLGGCTAFLSALIALVSLILTYRALLIVLPECRANHLHAATRKSSAD